jgi:hypothetical protein|tara:strand:- start:654 stop:884 length:231 start_codon:yes stop_codon:yes gene_type:complete
MGSLFKPKMPPLPPVQPLPEPPPAVPEKMSVEDKESIAKKQAAVERKRKGRKSTILTSPLGVEEEAETQNKTLLGS